MGINITGRKSKRKAFITQTTCLWKEAGGKEISIPSVPKHCLKYLLFVSQYLKEVPTNMKPSCTYSRQQHTLSYSQQSTTKYKRTGWQYHTHWGSMSWTCNKLATELGIILLPGKLLQLSTAQTMLHHCCTSLLLEAKDSIFKECLKINQKKA